MAIDYAVCGRLRKLRPKEAWETIKDLAQQKEEEWNDPIFSNKESPDYIDATLEQELENSGVNKRPPMIERGNYIPWESRSRRFLDNKLEEGERMWNSIKNESYVRPMIHNPNGAENINVIPDDIYNSMDACKNAKEMWDQIKRLMFGYDVTSH
nr:hypothetical protein [Tanacetum cinerariifolium]